MTTEERDELDEQRQVVFLSDDYLPTGYGDLRAIPGPEAELVTELSLICRTMRGLKSPFLELGRLIALHSDAPETWELSVTIWTGILIQYARCFDGAARHVLDPELVFSGTRLGAIHAEAMLVRSKHLAHDVNSLRRAQVGVQLKPNGYFGKMVTPFAQLLPNEEIVRNTGALIDAVLSYGDKERRVAKNRLMDRLRSMSASDRAALPKLVIEAHDDETITRARRKPKPRVKG